MEASIRQLQQQGHGTLGPMVGGSVRGDDRADSETIAVADEERSTGPVGASPTDHEASEMGEIDISENSIDGMGAMKFTDEEDCGYFGKCCEPSKSPSSVGDADTAN